MFGLVLIYIVSVMHVYVFWRASSVPLVKRRLRLRYLMIAGAALWAIFVLGRLYGHGSEGALAKAVELFGMDWMAVVFLCSVSLAFVDIITGFGLLLRRVAPGLRGLALMAGAVLSLIAVYQGMRPPVVRNYEVTLPGLSPELDGTVMAAMSDLHVGGQLGREWLDARVGQVLDLKPDIIVLLGDILEGHGPPKEEYISSLGKLSAPLGVWAVLGNHEFHGQRDNGPSPLARAGIRVLSNSSVEVRPSLVLAGVDDLTANHRSGVKGDPVTKTLSNRPPGATVLLSHTPWEAEEAAKAGAGLMLSGHTHGGQVWPFGCLVKRIYPLLAGRYDVDGMAVIVSRGTGLWGPRMRLWRPGEILRVKLRAAL